MLASDTLHLLIEHNLVLHVHLLSFHQNFPFINVSLMGMLIYFIEVTIRIIMVDELLYIVNFATNNSHMYCLSYENHMIIMCVSNLWVSYVVDHMWPSCLYTFRKKLYVFEPCQFKICFVVILFCSVMD